jgi:type VI secretion system protein ImpF
MIVFSVLDRLMDDPEVEIVRRLPEHQRSKEEFKIYLAKVRRDLEWLLNTRRISDSVPDHLKDVARSVYNYGLPDFSQENLASQRNEQHRDRFASTIARTIELFEPRILDVRVLALPKQGTDPRIRFQVMGRLNVEPRPEPICYDTVLDSATGAYEVLGVARA